MASQATIYDYPQIYKRLNMQLGHFGCIMLDVTPIPVSDILGVQPDWYYYSKNPILRYVKGPVAETVAHATLLYGLTPDDNAGVNQKDSVNELLVGLDLSDVTIDEVDSFPPQMAGEPYMCVVAKLNTQGDLGEANRRLRFLPHIDTFVEYAPHVTLAYIREEELDETVNTLNNALAGNILPAIGINYGGPIH